MSMYLFTTMINKSDSVSDHYKICYFCNPETIHRGVAQLVARYVRDVEAGSSSLLTPTNEKAFPRKRKGFVFPTR